MRKILKPKFIFIGILLILLVSGYFYLNKSRESNGYQDVELVSTVVKRTVSASGEIISSDEANLSFPTMGKVTFINVMKGEEIKSGQYIASLNSYSTSQGAQAAKSAVDAAKKDLELYIENYDTNRDAVGGSDEYKLNIQKLENLVSQSESNYQAQLGNLNNFELYAPFNGTAVDIFYEVGETALAGQPVVKIADLNNLVFEISIDQEDFGLVKLGQKVLLTLDSYEDVTFEGEVSELPLYADENTGDFTIQISVVQDESNPVLLGMRGDAEIVIESTEEEVNALLFDSIFEDEEGTYVWVQEGGEKIKEYIEIGLEGDLYTEVKTELSNKKIILPEQE